MTTTKTFLIRASNGLEGVMRLPIRQDREITPKGFKMIRARFNSPIKHAVNLEEFNTGEYLLKAITKYQKEI